MKSRLISTILTSAYLSAMLALSVVPICSVAAEPAHNNKVPKADPVMTDELMTQMIKLAEEQKEPGSISANVCSIFNLCDGTSPLKVKMLETDNPPNHYFTIPWAPGSKDIVIVNALPDHVEAYLTDKTYKLRAAAISTPAGAHLITNEKAAEKFKAELALFAKEAAALPPTEALAPGNK